LRANNKINLNLSINFSTLKGPDKRAYLVDSNGISDSVLAAALIEGLNNFKFGLTQAEKQQNFTV